MRRAVLAIVMFASSCATHPSPQSAPAPQRAAAAARMMVRASELTVTVDSVSTAAAEVEQLVTETGGFVERSSEKGNGVRFMLCRIPAPLLDTVMNRVGALGRQQHRTISTDDVTEQYTDLEARLPASIALRDHLQQLLARAEGVSDVLTVERELTRVQTDIEALEMRIERLRKDTRLASLAVSLQRKHQSVPLSYLGYGLWLTH